MIKIKNKKTEFNCVVGMTDEVANKAMIFGKPYFKDEFWSFLPAKLMKKFRKGDKVKITVEKI